MQIGTIIPFLMYGQHVTNNVLAIQDGAVQGPAQTIRHIDANGDGSGNMTANAIGVFSPADYAVHVLSKWDAKMHITNLSADAYVAIGIYDTPKWSDATTSTPRNWFFFVDRVNGTVGVNQFEPNFNIEPYKVRITPAFNYADFTLIAHYASGYISFCLRDSNGIAVWGQYRFDMRGGYQLPAPGSFAFKLYTGTCTLNEISFSSRHAIGVDYIVIGDSISVGRKNYPETYRFSDRVAELFRAEGNPKNIQTWASGGMSVRVELVSLIPSFIAAQPLNVIVMLGDNDNDYDLGDINDLATVKGKLGKFVSDLRAAGIIVHCISLTPERYTAGENSATTGQRHDAEHAYLQSGTFNAELVAKYGVGCHIINIWDVLKLPNGSDPGYPGRETIDPVYVQPDYVHLNILGHSTSAASIKAQL